jgi:hypothetical protein
MRARHALASLVVVVAAAVGASGCGGALQLDPVARAANVTAKEPTMHMTLTATVTTQGHAVELSGSGDFDNAAHVGALSIRFSAGETTGSMNEVIKDTTIYLSSSLFANQLPAGKSWVRLDLEKAGKTLGIDVANALSQTPSSAFEQLKGQGDVQKVGQETIDGVRTTRYLAYVDESKVPQKLKDLHPTYEPSEIWVDRAGRLRRLETALSVDAAPASAARAETRTRMDFSRFGAPVNIGVPSDDQSVDLTDLAANALQNGG